MVDQPSILTSLDKAMTFTHWIVKSNEMWD